MGDPAVTEGIAHERRYGNEPGKLIKKHPNKLKFRRYNTPWKWKL
jgi:hypothetical protein